MARKTITFTATDGRDDGKQFIITEMGAAKAENWAMRALLALMSSGIDVPEGFEQNGMAGMAELGLRAVSRLKWDVAEPLINEMMDCVRFMPTPSKPHIVRDVMGDDIEEVTTRFKLRIAVLELHTGFSLAADKSKADEAAA